MMDNNELIEIDERCILTIYSTYTKDGQEAFRYDLPDKEKLFKLIGFMEAIKLDLLDFANDKYSNTED